MWGVVGVTNLVTLLWVRFAAMKIDAAE